MKNGEICDILDLVHNLKKFQLKIQNLFFAFYFRVLSHLERSVMLCFDFLGYYWAFLLTLAKIKLTKIQPKP